MALALGSPYRTREPEASRIITTEGFAYPVSDLRRLPAPPRPPRPRQPPLPNRHAGVWGDQAAHTTSGLNDNPRPPAITHFQLGQENEGIRAGASSANAPPSSVRARPRWQPSVQPPTGLQARNRDEGMSGNGGIEPPDQHSSVSGVGGRPHDEDNQSAQRSNITQNSNGPTALNPATEMLVLKRDALRRKARVQKRAGTVTGVEAQRREFVQDVAQPQSPPYSTPSPNPPWASSYPGRQVHIPAPRHTTAPPALDTSRLGSGPPASAGTTTRAPTLPIIIDRSDASFSSNGDDSADEADSVRAILEGYTRPAYERISLHLPAAHRGRSQTEPQPRRATSVPCVICFDVPDEFPHHRPTSNCTHASTICASCLEQYISHAVRSEGLTTLACPDPECRKPMEHADVVRGASKDRACLDRYETLLHIRRLEKEPNFVRCKNPTCNWGQIHERGAAIPIVACQRCRARSCFTHDVPWHTGLTCEQYTNTQRVKREAEEQANQTYIDQHAKICPNPSCGRWIEKTEGCDHMTCRRPAGCGHEFCWICLVNYRLILREGSHRHAPNCRHHIPQGAHAHPIIVDIPPMPGGRGRPLLRRTVRPWPPVPTRPVPPRPWWSRLFGWASRS